MKEKKVREKFGECHNHKPQPLEIKCGAALDMFLRLSFYSQIELNGFGLPYYVATSVDYLCRPYLAIIIRIVTYLTYIKIMKIVLVYIYRLWCIIPKLT